MDDAQAPLDNGATNSVASNPVAPPSNGSAGEQPGSTPAPVDTTASGQAKPEGEKPEQTRRESRAFATLRRENRELYRRLGGLEAMLEQRASQSQPAEGDAAPQQRQTPSPSPVDEAQADLNRSILERIEDAGEEYEEVVEKITARNFPMTVAMRDYLATSDKPADLAKALADDPKEARRISLLSERAADRAMEKLEAGLKAATKASPKTTQAPPPVPTVGGRSVASFDPQKASMEEYAADWKRRQASR